MIYQESDPAQIWLLLFMKARSNFPKVQKISILALYRVQYEMH